MARIKAEEVRLFCRAQEAAVTPRLGRPLREALALLTQTVKPDPSFADDMEAVLDSVGSVPSDPRARS